MVIDIESLILDAEIAAKRARISVDDLCKLVGVNRATWQRWKARRTSPSADSCNRISQVIGELAARQTVAA